MKKRDARVILFISVPILIFALGILFVMVFLRSTITNYVENLLEEKIGSHLDQSAGDLLDVHVKKIKFNAFPITVSTPEISIIAAIEMYSEDGIAMQYKYVHEAGVENLEISLKPLLLIACGLKKFNVNRLRADSVYFSTKYISDETGVVFNSRRKILTGPIGFKGKIKLPNRDNSGLENLKFEKHSFQAANLSIYLPKDLYSFQIESISLDGSTNSISMEKIKMIPKYPKEELYLHVDFEAERIEIDLDKIEIKGLQTHKKNDRRGLIISRVNIRNGVVDVFRDRRPPFNEEQRRDLPTKIIMTAPIDLFVAEIYIGETDILYSEFPEDGSESGFQEAVGYVPFNRMEATIKNITNIPDSLQRDSIMHISAEAFSFDDAILRADFIYNLNDINGGYRADVELSEFRFETINPALYPLTGIKVKEGIHKISLFSFIGNDVESRGELFMEWDDLLLDFAPNSGVVIAGITRTLGKIIYHKSSPENINRSSTGDIYFERDPTRFVFHYWWNCYLTGIKNSVLRDFVPQ